MKNVAFVAVLLLTGLLSGCAANRIDYNQASMNLALGMSKQQVQSVLGDPRRTDVNASRERWIYWNPVMVGFTPVDNESLAQDRLVVTFEDGEVARWGKQTLADDMLEASQKMMGETYNARPNDSGGNP
ncbi:outer membrane protein assembly factor BamE domain-containing protein [Halomonas caseinilytica]|uniref:SmpA / OmlA family protein n=1 Tax=Halomonas caseinilytica TaxID=438744 RepID=A0A1M6TAW1_9GAMM|nr:outer membrane protein assembly factor BamE [Halomonas caseinilytica]SHK54004.1 SmpA / OmlA family protein [Halomonas caseinilytica]